MAFRGTDYFAYNEESMLHVKERREREEEGEREGFNL